MPCPLAGASFPSYSPLIHRAAQIAPKNPFCVYRRSSAFIGGSLFPVQLLNAAYFGTLGLSSAFKSPSAYCTRRDPCDWRVFGRIVSLLCRAPI
jgi:hypothetical protein